jgi:hypothetical protein
MKRKITSFIALTTIIGAFITPSQSFADDQQPITVYVDGQQLNFEVSPVIKDGSTLVPLRALFEKFGMKVSWDSITQTITGTKDGLRVQMQIANTNATVNGTTVMLEVPPSIINGSTLVPLRFIGEASGNGISWNGTNRRVDVKSKDNSVAKVVTRAEVSRYLVRSMGLYDDKATADLKDVPEYNEYFRDIASAINNNIIYSYEDGNFRPNGLMTRAEYATNVVRALNIPLQPSNTNSNSTIKDYDLIPAWAIDYVNTALNSGLIELFEDGTFKANSTIVLAIGKPDQRLADLRAKYYQAPVQPSAKDNELNLEFLELNKSYTSPDNNMSVTVSKIDVIDKGGFYEYTLTYEQRNNTNDKSIDEATFKIYYQNGESEPQYGFFGKLMPTESVTRTYTYKATKSQKAFCLEYGTNSFFSVKPSNSTLKWKVPITP